ncbi:hypothetical protein CRUP_011795 [Coryphaenoides rupestris]|nr:hypothetical protein CRUP_011795 [Coryphaenoides rupestris]
MWSRSLRVCGAACASRAAPRTLSPYRGFSTKNGHIVVAAGNDKQFVKVCQVLGLTDLTEDSNYKTNTLRVKHRKPLIHTLSQRLLEMDTADWLRLFEGSGVPVGPINSIQEVFSSPQALWQSKATFGWFLSFYGSEGRRPRR